jgi:hypothetical protein
MAPSLGELEVDHPPLPAGSPSIEPAIHVEHNHQDRDPDLLNPDHRAAGRKRSVRDQALIEAQAAG